MSDKKSSPAPDLDLFGAPVDQIRDRWGRKSFAKTEENQRLVAVLKARGWSQARISKYLGCDEKTLRKHFSRELAAGADLIEGDALAVLLAKMRQGNMAALKRVLDVCDQGRAAPPDAFVSSVHGKMGPAQNAGPDEGPEEKLGKKAQLALEARTPKGKWAGTLN
jgi:lambda repressor-like predicted transcriptional regulator